MTVSGTAGAECGTIQSGTDGEADVGANCAIASGSLRPNGLGLFHYVLDHSVSNNDPHVRISQGGVSQGAGATLVQIPFACEIIPVTGDGTTYDVPIGNSGGSSGVVEIVWARKTDNGKIHVVIEGRTVISSAQGVDASHTKFALNGSGINTTASWSVGDTLFHTGFAAGANNGFFVITAINDTTHYEVAITWSATTDAGTAAWELNPSKAFTPVLNGPIGMLLRIGIAAPYPIQLFYDADAMGSWVLQQAGASAVAPVVNGGFYFGEALGKGINHNWKMFLDDAVQEDNGGSFNTSCPIAHADIVLEGVPSADTGSRNDPGWQNNNTAAQCAAYGSANCYAQVNEVPEAVVNYLKFVGVGATFAGSAGQTFPTTSRVLSALVNPTVMYVRACATQNIVVANGISVGTFLHMQSGTDAQNGAGTIAALFKWMSAAVGRDHDLRNVAWTAATAQEVEIGVVTIGQAPGSCDFRVSEMYKIVTLRQVPATPAAISAQVI